MGAISAAIGDGVLTFMWVFCASTIGAATTIIASALGVGLQSMAALFLTTAIVFVLVLVFGIIGEALGGASFNPTGTAAFYAAGIGSDSLFSMALRFPAQAAGAVGGALAIVEVMPIHYKHMLGGPTLKVDLHTGAMVEGVLTFIITFAVLFIVLRGPNNPVLKTWLLAMSTVALIVAGSGYTGPSMNPANEIRRGRSGGGRGSVSASKSISWLGSYRIIVEEKVIRIVVYQKCLWVGIYKQLAQHMGAILRVLDLSICWRDCGSLGFPFGIPSPGP